MMMAAGLLLTGCSSVRSTKDIVSSNSGWESIAGAEDTADDSVEPGAESASEDHAAAGDSSETTIEEQVILDANGVTITAVEYVNDSIWGDGIKVLIENNSASDIGVGCDALIVNDYMITDLFSTQVAAGKKSNETIDLLTSELKAAGIDNVGQVEMRLHLYDPNNYSTTYTSDMITLQTNHYADMDTAANDDGIELYNDGSIRIVGKYVDENSFWGNAIVLYLENNSGQNIGVHCENLSVNGYMMTAYFSSTVYSGKKAIDEITLLQNELDENGITSVDDVELTFQIYNPDTYSTIAESGIVQFSTR